MVEQYARRRNEGRSQVHTLWKHCWWHNWDAVWDKIAAEWAGTKDWMGKRSGKNTLADKHKFVIFALDRMDLCTIHRKGKGNGKGTRKGSKTPRDLAQADTIINKRDVGTTLDLCGDRWSASGSIKVGKKYQKKIGTIQKNLHQWWCKKLASPISEIDNYVTHIFR